MATQVIMCLVDEVGKFQCERNMIFLLAVNDMNWPLWLINEAARYGQWLRE